MLFSFRPDQQQFEEAAALHRSGRLKEAEALYRQILAVNPNHADTLHMMGLLAHQGKRSDVAVDLIERSLKISPSAMTCSNLAEIKRTLGQLDAAAELCRRAIAMDPNISAAYVNLAMALRQAGKVQEALAPALRGVELAPADGTARSIAGSLLLDLGRGPESVVHFEEAARLSMWDPMILTSLGVCFQRLERMDRALALQQRAAALAPQNVRVLLNLAAILANLDQFPESARWIRKALEIEPDNVEALEHLASVQQSLGKMEESVELCRRAIAKDPQALAAYATMGEALMGLGRFDECIELMSKITETRPHSVLYHAWSNALVRRGSPAEGIEVLKKALAMDPENPVLHFNRSVILLVMGRMAEAWPEYEWRWRHPRVVGRVYKYPTPRWQGEELHGKRIVLFAEQGLGDTVFFGRYVPQVAQRGGQVIMRVQSSLKEVVATIQGVWRVVADSEPAPDHDVHCPIMSLPGVFGTTLETVPAQVPYIRTDPARSAHWRQELARRTSKFKVGLVWEGGAFQMENFLRSCKLADYAPLGAVEGVAFFGLQKGPAEVQSKTPPPGMDFTDLGPFIKDFSDTAAIEENLDLLISIDTAVIHIAGALAKPIWMLMAFTPGHMWMHKRSDSPWYPTIRIFRQPAFQDWASVVQVIKGELERVIAARNRGESVTLP